MRKMMMILELKIVTDTPFGMTKLQRIKPFWTWTTCNPSRVRASISTPNPFDRSSSHLLAVCGAVSSILILFLSLSFFLSLCCRWWAPWQQNWIKLLEVLLLLFFSFVFFYDGQTLLVSLGMFKLEVVIDRTTSGSCWFEEKSYDKILSGQKEK